MLLLVFLIVFLCSQAQTVFAVSTPIPQIVITNIPDNSVAGNNFSVEFTLSNVEIGTSFYYKIFGGVGESTSLIQTFNNSNYLNYTTSWADFPIIVVGDTLPITVQTSGRANGSAGIYNVKIRVAKVSNTSSKYDSEPKTIDIIAPTPTSVPAPTSAPTSAPTPTKSPTSAPIATSNPTQSPTTSILPTSIPTPIQTSDNSQNIESTIIADSDVLGVQVTVSDKQNSEKSINYLGLSFIIIGGLLLLTPLLFTKIKRFKKQ